MDLVTGATGFVGGALVREMIKEGRAVRVLSRKASDLSQLKDLDIQIVYGDLTNKKSLEKATKDIDNVVHLAVARRGKSLDSMNEINVDGTKRLLNACEKNDVKHFLFFSSVTVYGESLNTHENSPLKPYDNYGKSKVVVEEIVREFRKHSKMNFTILRPSYIYGPGDPYNIFNIIKTIKKRRFAIFGSGENLFNMVFIDDVVNATLTILRNPDVQNREYIISDIKPYSLCELSEIISDRLKVRKPVKIPRIVGLTAGICFDLVSKVSGKKLPLSKSRAKNITRSRSFRIDRARKEINYEPKVQLKEGIKRTVDWAEENNLL